MRYTPSQAFQLVKGYSPNPKSWRPVVYNAELGDALLLMDFATAPTGARWKEESELLVDQIRQSSPASPTTSCKEQATWCERAEAVYLAGKSHKLTVSKAYIRQW